MNRSNAIFIAVLILVSAAAGTAQDFEACGTEVRRDIRAEGREGRPGLLRHVLVSQRRRVCPGHGGGRRAVTGFVSRYGEGESDKGAFLDQFFRSGKLENAKLTFVTETVHGVWFEFKGTVERGEGKNPGDEGYYVLKGTLTQSTTDSDKKVSSHSREVLFKMFPQEASPSPQTRN